MSLWHLSIFADNSVSQKNIKKNHSWSVGLSVCLSALSVCTSVSPQDVNIFGGINSKYQFLYLFVLSIAYVKGLVSKAAVQTASKTSNAESKQLIQ